MRIGKPLEMDVIDDAADDGGVIFFNAMILLPSICAACDYAIADLCEVTATYFLIVIAHLSWSAYCLCGFERE